jgi:hypothetical protein
VCVVAAVRVEMEVSKRKARADSPAPERERVPSPSAHTPRHVHPQRTARHATVRRPRAERGSPKAATGHRSRGRGREHWWRRERIELQVLGTGLGAPARVSAGSLRRRRTTARASLRSGPLCTPRREAGHPVRSPLVRGEPLIAFSLAGSWPKRGCRGWFGRRSKMWGTVA